MRNLIRVGVVAIALALGARQLAAAADVVAIVAAKSPITSLTPSQLSDIFLGRTSRFPDGGKAVAIDQPEGSASRDAFYATYTGKSAAQVKAHWSKIIFTGRGRPPAQVADGEAVRKWVAENLTAIGYIETTLVDDTVRAIVPEDR